MTQLESVLRRAVADLGDAGARFALVGGLAISVRTEPRFTRDADLVVAVADDGEAEGLIRRLQSDGYTVSATVEREVLGRLATVRLTPPRSADVSVVDLLFASSGIESEVVAQAESIEILPTLIVPVAQVDHLIALVAAYLSSSVATVRTRIVSSVSSTRRTTSVATRPVFPRVRRKNV